MFYKLKNEYFKCTKCPLLQDRIQAVFGEGNPHADLLFIGEAPGANEDKQGIPFCGMSGKILNELLESVNLARENIFITNTILCRPPNNRNPNKEELSNCNSRLNKLIEIMQPKVIVTIGNFATEQILGKKGITMLRGKIFEKNGKIVIPIIHPAGYFYSGRNPELFKKMKSDFQIISTIINND